MFVSLCPLPNWQRQVARIVLVRTLGAARASDLCERAYGFGAVPLLPGSPLPERNEALSRFFASSANYLVGAVGVGAAGVGTARAAAGTTGGGGGAAAAAAAAAAARF